MSLSVNPKFSKITVITGHYGCGKTNVAANIALKLAKSKNKVSVVDLDIVNPYFRSADFTELFREHNIELITPMYANSNLDIPALSFDLGAIINREGYIIIDVGGDPEGAAALGRYGNLLKNRQGKDLSLYYVINCFRLLTFTPEEALDLLKEIKAASALFCDGIINNSNLGNLTDNLIVKKSLKYAEEVADMAGVPLLFTCCEQKNLEGIDNAMDIEIFVKPPWEA